MASNSKFYQEIPVTISQKNFLNKYHPTPIKADLSDPIGLTFLSILTYRNKTQKLDIDREVYSETIKLHIQQSEILRRGKIVRRMAVIAIHEYITKLLYSELEKYVSIETVRFLGKKKMTLNDAIEEFRVEYGLLEGEYNFLRLHQHIIRKNRKARKNGSKSIYNR